ncbi:MAG: SIR2 family protein, partial [Chloroflexi bacterium]|nr:SIR2 family protein [Chloroflexota bacterium]
MEIPVELIEQIEKGNCVLFLGWADISGRNASVGNELNEKLLTQLLAERVKYPSPSAPLYNVAEYFQVMRGRQVKSNYLVDVIENASGRAPDYYQTVANLPFNIIVSTGLDNYLKRILQERGRRFVYLLRDEEISFIDDDKLLVVKLYGDIDNRASIVVTREDYIAFFDQLPSISDLLKYYFSTKTLLFIGFDLDDPHFLQLYAYANQRTKGYRRRAFAVKPEPSQYEIQFWGERNLTVLDTTPNDFLESLGAILHISHIPPKDAIASIWVSEHPEPQFHKSPYKFLSSYEEQDVDIFYGRDYDIIRVIQKLLSSKLMVLYGKSGFGKTSLLNAGIAPRLTQNNYLTVYSRCAGDPLLSIKANTIDRVRQLNDASLAEAVPHTQNAIDSSLAKFIRELKRVEKRSLIIFIDQFEEFFISLGDATKTQFEQELAECIDSPYIDATFLLCLREDFLPELHELKRLHNILENGYRLKALTDETAKQAIIMPA